MIIPLFPLNMVTFPKMPVPLHIFEEKYKAMLEYCLREGVMFGIILNQNNTLNRVGCAMSVTKVFQDYGDGRKDILAVGKRRFRIKSLVDGEAYLRADVEFFDDLADESEEQGFEKLTADTLELYKQYLKKIHPNKAEHYQVFFEEPYNQVSFRMASAITAEHKLKQKLLETLSETDRLIELKDYFATKVQSSQSANPFVRQLQQEHNFSNN